MTVAVWIIAVCELIRIVQNMLQLMMVKHDASARDNAYAEFVKSLKSTDSEFMDRLIKEYELAKEAEAEESAD